MSSSEGKLRVTSVSKDGSGKCEAIRVSWIFWVDKEIRLESSRMCEIEVGVVIVWMCVDGEEGQGEDGGEGDEVGLLEKDCDVEWTDVC